MPSLALRLTAVLLGVIAAACGDSSSEPSEPPASLALAPVDSGLDFPVLVVAPPGDPTRLLIVQRGGRILLRKNGVRLDSAFVNLTSLTNPPGFDLEYGVLGVAFHPEYLSNRRLFVYYLDLNEDPVLVELQAESNFDHASPFPVETLLQFDTPDYAIHFGGTVDFGPDGFLYLATGDGETGGSPTTPSQDSMSLLGKMLRLDVDGGAPYRIPGDNPFTGRIGWRGEIFHLGLRNPYRWSFDRHNGDMWLGDVGEDTREEVDFLRSTDRGKNLGWPYREGTVCFRPASNCPSSGLTPPVYEYDHADGCSVIGGFVYRGSAIPGRHGYYIFGDFCDNVLRSFRRGTDGQAADFETWALPIPADNTTGFGEDSERELYVAMASGRVYKVVAE
jgi:glucose/arabinose dehydrogenase